MSAPISTIPPRGSWHERLRIARTARGVSQTEISRAIGVSTPTVSEWESGRIQDIKGTNLLKLCQYLRIHQDWLLHGRGDMDGIDYPLPTHPITDLTPARQEIVQLMQQLADFQLSDIIATLRKQAAANQEILKQLGNK